MLSHSTEIEKFPSALYNADIALILKPDRDDTNPASYHPISMLNMDFKIFTKILANRLNHCIESLIHRDPDPQTEILSWLAIEQSLPQKTSLRENVFSLPRPRASCKGEHYTIINAQKIWTQIRKFCELPKTSVQAPIRHNHAFLPSSTDTVFKECSRKGIGSIKDLDVDKHLCSFELLQKNMTCQNQTSLGIYSYVII